MTDPIKSCFYLAFFCIGIACGVFLQDNFLIIVFSILAGMEIQRICESPLGV